MPYRFRSNVLRMEPYTPGKPIEELRRELGLERIVKLASNETPLGPSPMAVEAVRQAAETMHLYPDASSFELRDALAAHYGVERNQVVVGNGSDELIHLLGQVFLGSGEDEMIVGNPTFVRYHAAAYLADCRLIEVALDGDQRHDLDSMAAAVGPKTKLVFLANPNNPTGTIVTRAEVEKFLDRMPAEVPVVLDEAYFEFAKDQPEYPDGAELLKAGRNVIVLRTFSKAYGLAGLRLGYGLVPAAVSDAIDRVREPYDVNRLAQAAGVAALKDAEHVRRTVELNRTGRERLMQVFTAQGCKPIPTHANFLIAELGRDDLQVFQALLHEGVIVRPGTPLGLPGYLRVSIGTEDEIEVFVKAFEKVMAVEAVR